MATRGRGRPRTTPGADDILIRRVHETMRDDPAVSRRAAIIKVAGRGSLRRLERRLTAPHGPTIDEGLAAALRDGPAETIVGMLLARAGVSDPTPQESDFLLTIAHLVIGYRGARTKNEAFGDLWTPEVIDTVDLATIVYAALAADDGEGRPSDGAAAARRLLAALPGAMPILGPYQSPEAEDAFMASVARVRPGPRETAKSPLPRYVSLAWFIDRPAGAGARPERDQGEFGRLLENDLGEPAASILSMPLPHQAAHAAIACSTLGEAKMASRVVSASVSAWEAGEEGLVAALAAAWLTPSVLEHAEASAARSGFVSPSVLHALSRIPLEDLHHVAALAASAAAGMDPRLAAGISESVNMSGGDGAYLHFVKECRLGTRIAAPAFGPDLAQSRRMQAQIRGERAERLDYWADTERSVSEGRMPAHGASGWVGRTHLPARTDIPWLIRWMSGAEGQAWLLDEALGSVTLKGVLSLLVRLKGGEAVCEAPAPVRPGHADDWDDPSNRAHAAVAYLSDEGARMAGNHVQPGDMARRVAVAVRVADRMQRLGTLFPDAGFDPLIGISKLAKRLGVDRDDARLVALFDGWLKDAKEGPAVIEGTGGRLTVEVAIEGMDRWRHAVVRSSHASRIAGVLGL